MKFVWVPSISRYRRTEGEVKKERQKYEVVEYETDKDSLIDRFNAYEERIEALQEQINLGGHTAAPQESTVETAPESEASVQPPPLKASAPTPSRVTVNSILEFILDEASVAQVESIFAVVGTRFAELAKKVRIDAQPQLAPPSPDGTVDDGQPQEEAAA